MLTSVLLAGLGLGLPLWAFGQALPMPVIPPVRAVHAQDNQAGGVDVPIWQREGMAVTVSAKGHVARPAPVTPTVALDGQGRSVGAGVQFTAGMGLTAHAGLGETRWSPLVSAGCQQLAADAVCSNWGAGVQHGEIGAGFAAYGLKLNLSLGQSHSDALNPPALARRVALPRVLPAEGGADVAAPLWFRNSTATSLRAQGRLDIAPDTSIDLGASVGRVHLLPDSGATDDDRLDQTTLSLGIQHGGVRGAIVGHVIEPSLPGATLNRNRRWSGIDLGVSVRLPWRGELNFGAQNVWTSGRPPLLFGAGPGVPDQGRVPYVQYHQILN